MSRRGDKGKHGARRRLPGVDDDDDTTQYMDTVIDVDDENAMKCDAGSDDEWNASDDDDDEEENDKKWIEEQEEKRRKKELKKQAKAADKAAKKAARSTLKVMSKADRKAIQRIMPQLLKDDDLFRRKMMADEAEERNDIIREADAEMIKRFGKKSCTRKPKVKFSFSGPADPSTTSTASRFSFGDDDGGDDDNFYNPPAKARKKGKQQDDDEWDPYQTVKKKKGKKNKGSPFGGSWKKHKEEPYEVDYPLDMHNMLGNAAHVPLRLTHTERRGLRLVTSVVSVNDYSEKVDNYSLLLPDPQKQQKQDAVQTRGGGVSEFGTTNVELKRLHAQLKNIYCTLLGLLVSGSGSSSNPLERFREADLLPHAKRFAELMEKTRRYKIMNPDLIRTEYGKFMFFLQDSELPACQDELGFGMGAPIVTVADVLARYGAEEMLSDPNMRVAITPIPRLNPISRLNKALRNKDLVVKDLIATYSKPNEGFSEEICERCIRSLDDGNCYVRDSAVCVDKLRKLLTSYWEEHHETEDDEVIADPLPAGDEMEDTEELNLTVDGTEGSNTQTEEDTLNSQLAGIKVSSPAPSDGNDALTKKEKQQLEKQKALAATDHSLLCIFEGVDGSRLTHNHNKQFRFVTQSLVLWRNVLIDMFHLWHCVEQDLVDDMATCPYHLRNTGQGLHRVQQSRRVYQRMCELVENAKKEVGHNNWVGSDKVHIGDNQVPNGLAFLDKYVQIPRIINPILKVLEWINERYDNQDPVRRGLQKFIDKTLGGSRAVTREILCDFFRHGFDGSGGDNMDDAGSCIDGRLTSAWNWCHNIKSKRYYSLFLLGGFSSFDDPNQ